MTRIRTIKPEFWDSPSTAQAGPWARLLYIALWNWADDFGRGTANLKELEGFAFPNDSTFTDRSGNTVQFRDVVAEVAECFGVVFYTVDERPYFEIPGWDRHQRNERRAKASKYPSPQVRAGVAEIPCNRADVPSISGPGTGEQGNRGTGESTSRPPLQTELTTPAPRPPRKTGTDIVLDNVRALNTQTSRHAEAAAIVTEFGAWLGTPLDAKTATETTAIVESCLIAGQTRDEIAAGMVLWSPSDSWSPSQIPKFITKAAARRKHRGVGKPTEKAITVAELAAELIAEMETTE